MDGDYRSVDSESVNISADVATGRDEALLMAMVYLSVGYVIPHRIIQERVMDPHGFQKRLFSRQIRVSNKVGRNVPEVYINYLIEKVLGEKMRGLEMDCFHVFWLFPVTRGEEYLQGIVHGQAIPYRKEGKCFILPEEIPRVNANLVLVDIRGDSFLVFADEYYEEVNLANVTSGGIL